MKKALDKKEVPSGGLTKAKSKAKIPAKGKALMAKGVKNCPTCGQPMPCGQKHK